jgi:DNA-binding IclR family transcriptional regulator/enamine deaminase RidA (YjgF/YER057c/UK114 family)
VAGPLRTPKNASVAKAFQILNVLSSGRREMTATEVAQTLGSNLPTVHRFLVTLEEIGAVSRTAQGKFQLGLMLVNLGDKVESNKQLIDRVQPQLNALAAEFREVAHCAVRNGSVAINVARALPDRSLVIGHAAGDSVPLHCSAVGKVLLASMPGVDRERFLSHIDLARFTAHTITDRGLLADELRRVAKNGFAIEDEEWEEGLRSVAVPIRNGGGQAVAAVALSAPASRLDDGTLTAVGTSLLARVERLEHALFTESRVFPQKARPRGPFPHIKRVDDFIFVSGTSARRPDDTFEGVRVQPDGRVVIDIRQQTRAVFGNIRDMLEGVGSGLTDVVDLHAYLTDMGDYGGFNEAYAEFFGFDGPTRTTVGVNELPHPHQHLMVRAVAYAPHSHFTESSQ